MEKAIDVRLASEDQQGIRIAKVVCLSVVIMVAAELIGSVTFNVGPGKVVMLPMVWALLIGAAVGMAKDRLPWGLSLDTAAQFDASRILQPALLLFIAKLGLLVGSSLPQLAASGWALALQEFGHFVGTIMIGLPLALILGIKREAIGATFSVGREPSLAIIAEKYGMDSPEGRGVLAEYLTGTVFGALFIAVLAGFLASLHLLDPVALAMGAGVGSGSMMAAASGAIAALQTPEVAKQVVTFAAASNLITTTIGTYFTLFISLPLAVWAYRVLEPVIGRKEHAVAAEKRAAAEPVIDHGAPLGTLGTLGTVGAWLLAASLTVIVEWMSRGTSPVVSIAAMGVILVPVVAGVAAVRLTGGRVPAVCMVSLFAMAMTSPWCPLAAQIADLTGKANFLSFLTPVLTFAGLSIAKDVPAFRRLGWRIVVVSLAANAGTFIGASLIAQFFHH